MLCHGLCHSPKLKANKFQIGRGSISIVIEPRPIKTGQDLYIQYCYKTVFTV